jgi:hypothetical protein
MSAFERLLAPGCTELPACRCGEEMQLASIDPLPDTADVHIRVYNCAACDHEMRLTVWADVEDAEIVGGQQPEKFSADEAASPMRTAPA